MYLKGLRLGFDAGMLDWLKSLRDLNFNGQVDIWQSRFGREERQGLQRSARS